MKLTVAGYEPLVFPPEVCKPMTGAFDGQTPYVAKIVARWKQKSYLQGKLPLKLMCLEILRDRAEELGGYSCSQVEPHASQCDSVIACLRERPTASREKPPVNRAAVALPPLTPRFWVDGRAQT